MRTFHSSKVHIAWTEKSDGSFRNHPERICMIPGQLWPTYCTSLQLTHSADVAQIQATQRAVGDLQVMADAAICCQENEGICWTSADCVPLVLWHPTLPVVVGVHAGWQPLSKGILQNVLHALEKKGVPLTECQVWLGPGIRAASYRTRLPPLQLSQQGWQECIQQKDMYWHIDLYAYIRFTLLEWKMNPQNITDCGDDTYQDATRYFSHARSKILDAPADDGRMAVIAWRSS